MRVESLSKKDTLELTLDARVVAMRWDILPWDLVFDMDVPARRDRDNFKRRAWLCFVGFSALTMPFDRARIPTGCWLIGPLAETAVSSEFSEYCVSGVAPKGRDDGSLESNPAIEIVVRAQAVLGLVSEEACRSGDAGLHWADRNGLCSDEEMMLAAGRCR